MDTEIEQRIVAYARPFMEGNHDFPHYWRVMAFGRAIWLKEGGDWDIIFAAVWLHDIGSKESREGHGAIGVEKAREFLPRISFPSYKIEAVAQAILRHDRPCVQETVEQKVVHDADRLDCFTHTGMVRCIIEPLLRGWVTDLTTSIRQAEEYLERAYASLNTDTARQIASFYRGKHLDVAMRELLEEREGGWCPPSPP